MENHMAETQAGTSDLTDMSFSQQAQLDDVSSGPKRRGRRPTQTPLERKMKKNEADRNYRKKNKEELDKLREMATSFGGAERIELWIGETKAELQRLQNKETEFRRFEQMKSKFGDIEEMESKLSKFDQIKSMFPGIDEIILLKNHQNEPPLADFLQQEDHGMRSVNVDNQVQGSGVEWWGDQEISEMVHAARTGPIPYLVDENVMSDMRMSKFNEMFPAASNGIMPDLVCPDVNVTDENVVSKVCLSGSSYLHGGCLTVGENSSTQLSVSIVNDILFDDHIHVPQIDESIVQKTMASFGAELEIMW